MEKILTVKQLAQACGGVAELCDEEKTVSDIVTDSRKVGRDTVFVALRGERFDGHNFAAQCIKNGAVCCVVDRGFENSEGLPVIYTDDTRRAFGALAAYYRRQFDIPSVAVTGSVGKTSTKDMIACVLSKRYKTLKTDGNFNNDIGLPLTMLRMSSEDEVAVFEMGMSNFGEISYLSKLAAPETAVLTNIGFSHIEFLKTQENILKAKLEILDGLSPDGAVIINGDDELLNDLYGSLPYETLSYGIENHSCDITAQNVKKFSDGTEFEVKVDGEIHKVTVNVPGLHHVSNALAAILVGLRYNIPVKDMIEGIGEFRPGGLRQSVERLKKFTLIRDCYNASPTSMKSGLEVLSVTSPSGMSDGFRRVAVLGEMLELGDFSEEAHENIGKLATEYELGCLVAVGDHAENVARGAINSGFASSEIYVFRDTETAKAHIGEILQPNDVILFKGSRGMRLEELADCVAELDANCADE